MQIDVCKIIRGNVTLSGENVTLSGQNNFTWNKGNKWKKKFKKIYKTILEESPNQ